MANARSLYLCVFLFETSLSMWPWLTWSYRDEGDLKIRDPPVFASLVLGGIPSSPQTPQWLLTATGDLPQEQGIQNSSRCTIAPWWLTLEMETGFIMSFGEENVPFSCPFLFGVLQVIDFVL